MREDWKGVAPNATEPSFMGKKIAIIAYSARAINYTARCTGLETLVLDCFADMDMRRSANDFVHINLEEFRNTEGKLENSTAYYLNAAIQSHLDKIRKMDYLVLGSSFENDLLAWENASKLNNYKGNDPHTAMKFRNPHELYHILQQHNIHFPKTLVIEISEGSITIHFYSPSENPVEIWSQSGNYDPNTFLTTICEYLSYPFVLKSANSGGGLGIFLINSQQDFLACFETLENLRRPPFIIQEYVQGVPMSCSFIANGEESKICTLSRQLIGDSRFGCKGRFTYCGNIMNNEISNPLHEQNIGITNQLHEITQILTKMGELRGSNGIDFQLFQQGNKPVVYFIELNPRFQGTIDLVLASTGENIIQHHINSFEKKKLPSDVCFPDEKTYLKGIYYSPLEFHIMVDLQGLEFRDVPLIGSLIHQSSPICSNITIGENIKDAYKKFFDDRDLMIRVLGLKSRIPKDNDFLKR